MVSQDDENRIANSYKAIQKISSNCLGCFDTPKLNTSLGFRSKGLQIHNNQTKNPSISEGFWTTSTYDMDNSAAQSQGSISISSISMCNQIVDVNAVASSTNTPSEFVNHGLVLWNQNRQRWMGNKKFENKPREIREPKLNWNTTTYDSLLGTNKPFPQPIPLPEMVDFLVDIWEQEGMYD